MEAIRRLSGGRPQPHVGSRPGPQASALPFADATTATEPSWAHSTSSRSESFPRMNTWGQPLCPGLANRPMMRRDGRPAAPEPSATTGTTGGRRVAACPVWAWEAVSTDSGSRPHALLLAREVAVDVAGSVGAARTPGIGSRRLRRCHIGGTHQSYICENQREN